MGESNVDGDLLLEEYRKIWKHRLLEKGERNSDEVLREAMQRELLDEYSHPRIRKNRYEKYYYAVKKLSDAAIQLEAKLQLIQKYNELMEKLAKEN